MTTVHLAEASSAKERSHWLFASFIKYIPKAHRLRFGDEHDRWRKVADLMRLSRAAKGRLEWIIWYEKNGNDVSRASRHFGISRKTFYKWHIRWNNKFLRGLEEEPRVPKRKRSRQYTARQYENVIYLRQQYIRYGKMKLLEIYKRIHPDDRSISSWKIQCIIKASGLYYEPKKVARTNRKRSIARTRKKITELKRKPISGFLVCLDTVVRYWNGRKRYILTAIDRHTKVAFARMYSTHSSAAATDFLKRLHLLLDGKIENIQTDNGSEFHKYFDQACENLGLQHYWSRVKTPKDNAVNERFNRTLQDEFLSLGNMTADTVQFNKGLTEWLIEYNFRRPHQSLNYLPPINFIFKYHKVLPMYPSSTSI
jgi:transposase InsO family protein